MASDKANRRDNFAARQRRIAARAQSRMKLAGISTVPRRRDGEGESLPLNEASQRTGGPCKTYAKRPG